jgi:hypothetical protein
MRATVRGLSSPSRAFAGAVGKTSAAKNMKTIVSEPMLLFMIDPVLPLEIDSVRQC